jgi:uncharacterized SAM-binding protein YcdF (DUF218 family)
VSIDANHCDHRTAWPVVRRRVLRLLGALAVAAAVTVASADAWLPAIGRWLDMPATAGVRRIDAIIVHGGNPARTLYGVELYQQGLAPELWHTGYASGEARVTAMIVDRTVPRQAFRYLATTSTWSDGTQIAAAIRNRKLHSVLIVTDWWHSRRALCATRQQLQGYDVAIAFAPSPAPAGPADWWRDSETRGLVLSELVKFGYYALAYGMAPWGC